MREKLFGFQEDALSDLHKRINSANSMLLSDAEEPVSYTHLDVYKRQDFCKSTPFSVQNALYHSVFTRKQRKTR